MYIAILPYIYSGAVLKQRRKWSITFGREEDSVPTKMLEGTFRKTHNVKRKMECSTNAQCETQSGGMKLFMEYYDSIVW